MTEWVFTLVRALHLLGGEAHSDRIAERARSLGEQNAVRNLKATVRDALQRYSADSTKGRKKGIKRGDPLDVFEFEPERRTSIFRFSDRSNPIVRFALSELDETSFEAELRKSEGAQSVVETLIDSIEVEKTVHVQEHWRRPPNSLGSEEILFHMIPGAPRPVAPFSHAVEADGWVILTGQMPTDPEAPDAPLPDGIAAQTRRVMENLEIVLKGVGLDLSHILQCRCYLTDFERDYTAFNETYAGYFPEDRRPARTTVGVTALALGALVEIDCLARRPGA